MNHPPPAPIDALPDAVLVVDAATLRIVAANARAVALFGEPLAALCSRCAPDLLVHTPEDLAFWDDVAAGRTEGLDSESFVGRADAPAVPVRRSVTRADGADGLAQWIVVLHDRRDSVDAADRYERMLSELQATLESIGDGVFVTDLDGRVRRCNRRFAQMWDVPEPLLARHRDDALFDWMRGRVADPSGWMRRLAEADDPATLPATDHIVLQSGRTLERVILPLLSHGQPLGRVHTFRDVTDRLAERAHFELMAGTDGLTGLANRRRLAERIEHALAVTRRDGAPFALLLVDLDRFRAVNESLGQHDGDRVLAEVAARLQLVVREADLVARLSADQFALLLPAAEMRGAQATAQRVQEALATPHRHGTTAFTVTACIGIALHPGMDGGVDGMLAAAEAAVREAKEAGRATTRVAAAIAERGDAVARRHMALDQAMREALAAGAFRVHYQPQVSMADGTICGAEALIRWRDAERGEVSPAEFIPAAEASGLIVPIGSFVLRQALQQAAAWREQGRAIRVAVNVSVVQFRQPGFVDEVAAALAAVDLPGDWLEIELTESILLRDAADARQRLEALAQIGVRLSIDDFGTGYSSLGYLKQLPIHKLKIDRSFIRGLPADDRDAGIVRAVVQMADCLGLAVIAEGVETIAQREFLAAAGCDAFQGFLVAPALPAAAFEELHDQHLAVSA
jgi:diguanylate cyclase (GGDEF)-like protein